MIAVRVGKFRAMASERTRVPAIDGRQREIRMRRADIPAGLSPAR